MGYPLRFFLLFVCCSHFLNGQDHVGLDDTVMKHALHQAPTEEVPMGHVALVADCEPLATVADCVNVASGHFFQAEQDLKGKTIDPLHFKRFYDSDSHYETFLGMGFGCQFPLLASDMEKSKKYSYAFVSERDGFLLSYQGDFDSYNDKRRYKVNPQVLEKGYTNLSRQETSGKDNFINWRADFKRHAQDGKFWVVKQGEGVIRTYGKGVMLSEKSQEEIDFPTKTVYLLTEQRKANGNRLIFDYEMIKGKPCLTRVKTLSRVGDVVLNALALSHSKDGCVVSSLCGHVSYDQVTGYMSPHKKLLDASQSSQQGTTVYTREKNVKYPKIVRVEKPEGRVLSVTYAKDQVVKLEAPVGKHNKMVPIYRFEYEKSYTKVWNALGQLTTYLFDRDQRPCLIQERDENQKVLKQKVFEWSERADQKGWLRAKSLAQGKSLFYRKTYRYDKRGNGIRETLYGNLTGLKPELFTLNEISAMDHYMIEHLYSEDGRNLLLATTRAEGLTIHYAYLPGTNLCTQELHSYHGQIQERIFKSYDSNGELALLIEDDGSGEAVDDLTHVSFRRLKSFITETQVGLASYGKPLQIIESYRHQTTGEILVLNRTLLVYDLQGNEIHRRLLDAQGNVQKEWTKSYDSRQRLVQETNPLGQATQYSYDENNNKISEIKDQHTLVYTYNAANRLKTKTETHLDGSVHFTKYQYNVLSQLIAETDPSGNVTTYTYDRLGRQISCTQPAMQESSGAVVQPTWKKEYNVWDQLIADTNEKGATTRYTYNSYGKPTSITYPDQSVERLAYYPWGWLKYKQLANGSSVHYTYDPKGRVLKETTYTPQGEELKNKYYAYKGPLLISQTDANGTVTQYRYDGAGRKIVEIVGDHLQLTTYHYDDLGRLSRTMEAINNHEGRWTLYHYDGLDRLIAKEVEDVDGQQAGQEAWVYDREGHVTRHVVAQTTERLATTEAFYNSTGDVLWKRDPLGHQTNWKYDHHFVNGLNQQVNHRAIVDSLGRQTQECDDALGRLSRRNLYTDGQESATTEYAYNPTGQLVRELSVVYANQTPVRQYGVDKVYDASDRLIQETEYPSGQTLRFSYDAYGRLMHKIKPGGVVLHYTYDILGRLSQLTSTDGTLHYTYTYDLLTLRTS